MIKRALQVLNEALSYMFLFASFMFVMMKLSPFSETKLMVIAFLFGLAIAFVGLAIEWIKGKNEQQTKR
jgi:hypothetical protein